MGEVRAVRILASRTWTCPCNSFRAVRLAASCCCRAVIWLGLGFSRFAVLALSALGNSASFVNFAPSISRIWTEPFAAYLDQGRCCHAICRAPTRRPTFPGSARRWSHAVLPHQFQCEGFVRARNSRRRWIDGHLDREGDQHLPSRFVRFTTLGQSDWITHIAPGGKTVFRAVILWEHIRTHGRLSRSRPFAAI
jgi:hypothetical protein